MKVRLALTLLFAASTLTSGLPATKAPAAAPVTPATAELNALLERIRERTKGGRPTAKTIAPELAELDALLAKYPDKNDDAGQIALARAAFYLQFAGDTAKGKELLAGVMQDYPGTKVAISAERLLQQQARDEADAAAASAARKKKADALVGQPAQDLHFRWSSQEDIKTLSSLKGRVVVLNFWTTQSDASIAAFPQIREHVARFKGTPVTFLGVTSLQGFIANLREARVATKGNASKETNLMSDFVKAHKMTWNVVFSTEPVLNPAYAVERVPYVAIIDPAGMIRHAGLNPGDSDADIPGKIEALLTEFNLPLPEKS